MLTENTMMLKSAWILNEMVSNGDCREVHKDIAVAECGRNSDVFFSSIKNDDGSTTEKYAVAV